MDRMSGLADETLNVIMGFNGAKEAARVLTLAKRFRNLHTIVGSLNFDDVNDFHGTFSEFVSERLGLLEDNQFVRRFSLKARAILDPADIAQWLRDVLKRGVVDVSLHIHGNNGAPLPLELFNSSSVGMLRLGRHLVISEVPATAALPALETLVLDSVRFHAFGDCAFQAFLSACPTLKDLTINGWFWETWRWGGMLSNNSLLRLTITRRMQGGFDGLDYQEISFQTPSLRYLDYTNFVPDAYPVVNLESLEEAKLYLQVVEDREWFGELLEDPDRLSSNPTNLIEGIKNTLYFFRESIPLFENLHHLTMRHSDMRVCWRFLPFLLSKTPNLKTLHIEGGLHYAQKSESLDYVCECVSEYSCLSSCAVEFMDINMWDDGAEGEMEQIKHFLGKLAHLELLKVHSLGGISDEDKLRITNHLLMLPRASPKCKVEISFR
ncbi:hypothetical protein F2Q70_00035578 [Brassica cretica]|uniref:FBD domain-containing protein n=1 Tax=Brassica cretica TaxID=69181 RepID=A0A8S9JPK7_BRACR|nr:hypothetical protein F2Q70_00035578 [Brassica cretica]